MYFLITVDTEGDDLWSWHEGQQITTENTLYIPRFQSLCEKYGFVPTYLTNYEMALDKRWVEYGGKKARKGQCEIGMHLHAWNTPPEFPLKNIYGGNPYITEYPDEIIDLKVSTMMELLQKQFEMCITSHRAGRWATNQVYFQSLVNHGIQIDCSVTPGLNLSKLPGCSRNIGNNYSKVPHKVYYIAENLLEIPMTTGKTRWLPLSGSILHKMEALLIGEPLWLRPIKGSKPMETLVKSIRKKKPDTYLEFMVHSSELMPGGSPYTRTPEQYEQFYAAMEAFFEYVASLNYQGCSLSEYKRMITKENINVENTYS